MTVPCGQCIGCRLARAKDWAVRAMHENHFVNNISAFVTLTYSDENMPLGRTLVPHHHTDFLKRLRYELGGKKITYYMAGEYSDPRPHIDLETGVVTEEGRRPHYHYLIFGEDFWNDRDYHSLTQSGEPQYTSPTLERAWKFGHCPLTEVTFASAAYVARYILKKQTGDSAAEHYTYVDSSGKLWSQEPEFARMSLDPAIGKRWYEKYGQTDVYDSGDFIVIDGRKYPTPRYYDVLLGNEDERALSNIKEKREGDARKRSDQYERRRLHDRHEHAKLKVEKLKRTLE